MQLNKMLLGALALCCAQAAIAATPAAIDAQRYQETVKTLSSDAMRGRGTGTPQLEKAARFMADEFKRAGIPPADGKSYYQRFTVTTSANLGAKNALAVTSGSTTAKLKSGEDFQPLNFSGNATVSGEVVFAGYGITANEYSYDDYAGLDVKGKIVMVLRHEPQEFDDKSVFAGRAYTTHAQTDFKASNARLHGAKAVLFINDIPVHSDADALDPFSRIVGPGGVTLPFVQIKASVADEWLRAAGTSLKEWMENTDRTLQPARVELKGLSVTLTSDVSRVSKQVPNICAYLRGESDEYVIIGAHYDHLGMGEFASMSPSQAGKAIHHGADDNASGAAGLIELAHYFKAQPKLKRGVLFLSFSGEELGLLGSAYYVSNPILPLEKAVAMINLDMIGRARNGRVLVGGTGTGTTLKTALDDAAKRSALTLDLSEQGGYGSSDHMSFNIKQIPVLFFFTGLHEDYHRPSDTWDKIAHTDAAALLALVADTASVLIGTSERPQYVRLGAPMAQASAMGSSRGYGPYFGSVPDMGESPGGAKISDVRDGSPAQKVGLQGGDIIIEFGGKPVGNLMDFTVALRAFKPGDEVLVKWRRGTETMEGRTVLTTRK